MFICLSLSLSAADNPFTEEAVVPANSNTDSATGEEAKVDGQFPVSGVVQAGSRLRLRSWPWGVVLGLYEPGTSVKVTGVSGEFYAVEVNGRKGYMHKNYISLPSRPASQVEPYYPGNTRSGGYLPLSEGVSTSAKNSGSNSSTSSSGSSSSSSNTSVSPSAAEAALAGYKGGRLSPAEFARLFGPVARESMKRTGVPASVTLAQAALETGWGASTIGDAKNLFGIKGTGPAGSISVPTQEFQNGRMVTIRDSFRKYHSWQESIEDHGRLLQNDRYRPALRYKNDPDRYAHAIHDAGYATDPNYASKLISIMKSNNFYRFDVK